METWAPAAAVVIAAALLRGVTGFGSGLIVVPVLALLYAPAVAVPTSVLIEIVAVLWLVPQAWRATHWPLVGALAIGYVPGIVLGTLILTALQPAALKLLIGATSISFAALLLGGRSVPAGGAIWPAAGLVGGLFTGTSNMGGPPVIVLLASRFRAKLALRSNVITGTGLQFFLAALVFALRGLLTAEVVVLTLVLLPGWLGGLWLGTRLYHRLPSERFRVVVLLAVVLASVPSMGVGLAELVAPR